MRGTSWHGRAADARGTVVRARMRDCAATQRGTHNDEVDTERRRGDASTQHRVTKGKRRTALIARGRVLTPISLLCNPRTIA